MTKHIVVIGGGMAGTAAAHQLATHGYKVTILEQNSYLGGRIRTQFMDGEAVEMGAGFMSSFYTNMRAFLKEEGLLNQLYKQNKSTGILRNGRVSMATLRTLSGQGALSHKAKLQMVPLVFATLLRWRKLNIHAFWKAHAYDTTTAADMFASSAAKKELLEYFWQPVCNGYFYWEPERVSRAMVLTLTKAFLKNRGTYKLRGGLCQIPKRAAKNATVLLGHSVKEVTWANGVYSIRIDQGGKSKKIQADGIVCATTATAVPRIFADLTLRQRSFFAAVQYSTTALVARTYPRGQSPRDIGIAFPRQEKTELAAVTVEPKGDVAAVNIYASGVAGKKLGRLSDAQLIARLDENAAAVNAAILPANAKPLHTHTQRWAEALPFFDIGHYKRLYAFERGEVEDPTQPLVFAGDYLGGPLMEGAFTSGLQAAERLHQRLSP
ncbi:MAG TPA: FAD-dependent oxidoreductase [Candidatus Saccharimonadales bacterium]|nr:FAD-dependent oxidoreductase [Candidatus Saccharimonadales bacterium]